MKVVTKIRTAYKGLVYEAGRELDMPKETAERFAAYGIVDIIPQPKVRKKANTQEKFKQNVEVK